MRRNIIKALKGPRAAKAIRERRDLYEHEGSREAIARYQTRRFNEVWAVALRDSPFYQQWAERHSLPQQIKDIRETVDFPSLKKRDLVECENALLKVPAGSFYVSGGSTGEPTKFPRQKFEGTLRYANNVITHSWLDLHPGDRYIHLWGHAHLFGQGQLAVLRKNLRKSKDWLVGGHRLNAYNQSREDTRNWISVIRRINPKYIVGYSSALVNLSIEIEESLGSLEIENLDWIICTAESISEVEQERWSRVFGVPVAIEYGANETGVIAHSRPSVNQRLQLLWVSLAGNIDKEGGLRLSTLDPRAFPLINYEIGDQVESPDDADQVLSFQSVLGRTSEQISLLLVDGTIGKISMVGVVGAIKNVTGVRTVQAAQLAHGHAEIYLTGTYDLHDGGMHEHFLHELGIAGVKVHPNALSFRHLEQPIKRVAGKTTLLVSRVNGAK